MSPRSLLRTTGIAEAVTWALLLGAMALKYLAMQADAGSLAISVAGGLHGVVFLLYLLSVIAISIDQHWPLWAAIVAGAAAVVPFATLAIAWWFQRAGLSSARWGASGLARWVRTHPLTLSASALALFLVMLTRSLAG